jgi:hypothetical protein
VMTPIVVCPSLHLSHFCLLPHSVPFAYRQLLG